MENLQWPDAEKLKELRQAGIFPVSRLSIRSVTSISVLMITYFSIPAFGEIVSNLRAIVAEPVTNFSGVRHGAGLLVKQFEKLILIYAAVYLVSNLLAVFAQSKFYISLVNFFSFSSVVRLRKASAAFFFITIIRGLFGIIFGLGLAYVLVRWIGPQVLEIAGKDSFAASAIPDFSLFLPAVKAAFVFLIIVLAVLALVSYFLVRFAFMIKHRTPKPPGG